MSNTDYTKANAYMADKCDVYITNTLNNVAPSWLYYDKEGNCITILDKWTITDPRCREIIREHYKIHTFRHYSMASERLRDKWSTQSGINFCGSGKTIAESEIATILAIVEAQDNG